MCDKSNPYMKLNQYPLLWNIKEIYSFHWYNTSFQFQVKPFLAAHAEFVLCILLASPAFVLLAGRQAGGKSVPSFLWTTIHFEGINYAFSFHCAWVLVACQLRSVLLRAALPNTSLYPGPPFLCSWSGLSRLLCAKSSGCSPFLAQENNLQGLSDNKSGRPGDSPSDWLTERLTDSLSEELPLAELGQGSPWPLLGPRCN